jgi:hypothetical protein
MAHTSEAAHMAAVRLFNRCRAVGLALSRESPQLQDAVLEGSIQQLTGRGELPGPSLLNP